MLRWRDQRKRVDYRRHDGCRKRGEEVGTETVTNSERQTRVHRVTVVPHDDRSINRGQSDQSLNCLESQDRQPSPQWPLLRGDIEEYKCCQRRTCGRREVRSRAAATSASIKLVKNEPWRVIRMTFGAPVRYCLSRHIFLNSHV